MACINDSVNFSSLALCVIILASGFISASLIATRSHLNLGKQLLVTYFLDLLVCGTTRYFEPCLSNDEATWHSLAMATERSLLGQGDPVSYVEGKEGFIWILGGLYWLGGPAPVIGISLNFAAHAMAVAAIAAIAKSIGTIAGLAHRNEAAEAAAWLAGLIPIFSWWSAYVLRETLTLALIALTLWLFISAIEGQKGWLALLAALPLGVLGWIRSSIAMGLALALIASWFVQAVTRSRLSRGGKLMLLVMGAAGVPALLAAATQQMGLDADSVVGTTNELSSIARSGFPGITKSSSLSNVLMITVPRILLGPFPWELSFSGAMLLAFAEWLCWLPILIATIRARRVFADSPILGNAGLAATFFAALSLASALSLSVGNYGILARFRPMITMTLIPIAATYLANRKQALNRERVIHEDTGVTLGSTGRRPPASGGDDQGAR